MNDLGARGLVFDPATSLGWNDGPLDGLSCVLRCAEAVLRSQGYDQREVARAFARPLDIAGARTQPSRFRHGELRWRGAADGAEHWAELRELAAAGVPVILMPDRFWWPGDEFEGRRHFLDHMVLVVALDDRELVVLDSDGPPEDGYLRRFPVTAALVTGACRFATIHFDRIVDTPQTLRATLLAPMATWLAEDLPTVADFAARWERAGLSGPDARALHIHVLGEWQPALFTTSIAVADPHPAVAAAADEAARAARFLGKALLAAHRYGGAQPESVEPYWPVLGRFRAAAAAMRRLVEALGDEIGAQPSAATDPEGADDRLWRRVAATRGWCYADEVAAPPS